MAHVTISRQEEFPEDFDIEFRFRFRFRLRRQMLIKDYFRSFLRVKTLIRRSRAFGGPLPRVLRGRQDDSCTYGSIAPKVLDFARGSVPAVVASGVLLPNNPLCTTKTDCTPGTKRNERHALPPQAIHRTPVWLARISWYSVRVVWWAQPSEWWRRDKRGNHNHHNHNLGLRACMNLRK